MGKGWLLVSVFVFVFPSSYPLTTKGKAHELPLEQKPNLLLTFQL